MWKQAMVVVLTTILCSCATPYMKYNPMVGGYEETILSKNTFRVSFIGNGGTSTLRANDMALLRCAELSLDNGYKYFLVTDNSASSNSNSMYIPGSSTSTYTGVAHAVPSGGGGVNVSGVVMQKTYHNPGVIVNADWPQVIITVVAFNEQDGSLPGLLDAVFVKQSIRNKYKIK